MASTEAEGRRRRPAHPLPVRIMHWIGAVAILCMISSGWAIYNASPSLPFTFPRWITLGGWLAGGIAWHISVMWILFLDGLAYLAYGLLSGHLGRDLRPRGPKAILRDLALALTGRLGHRLGHYNAVQRLLYSGVLLVICLTVATGLSIWKPVQLGWLVGFFGGYDTARLIHLSSMLCIVAFLIIHLVLVMLYPRTLVSMLSDRPSEPDEAPR
ncbi:MAG TPA: cytochrome b/b6 domain-containing protein [Stellaceae bacterium]|jgi:thiosulfate reductase cytochrome b subunit|nr:cytochrome b/b6 domain-containing protein [Stellaceae bacterium]